METLESRKAKFREWMDKATAYEEDDEIPKALKAYREALKYSLHKKDSDFIQQKIQRLRDTQEFVNGVPESKSGNPMLLWGSIGAVALLILLAGAVVLFLL